MNQTPHCPARDERRSPARAVSIGAVLLCAGLLAAGEPPPLEATVFYSNDDSNWKAAEKVLDAVVRETPGVTVRKVSIDSDDGYWELHAAEQRLHLIESGDLTLVVGDVALISKGARREVEKCFGPMVRRLRDPNDGKGRLPVDLDAYAAEVFGKDARLAPAGDAKDDSAPYRYRAVTSGDAKVGWVVDAHRPVICPTCADMQFLLAVALPEIKVLDLRPRRELERYGADIEKDESKLFLAQFKDRTPAAAAPVDVITGATKTCRMYAAAVKEILAALQKREKP